MRKLNTLYEKCLFYFYFIFMEESKMKKFLAVILALVMVMAFVACTKTEPVVDDATYDEAKNRVLEIESEYPELAVNGYSTHVGAAVSDKFQSYPHTLQYMLFRN